MTETIAWIVNRLDTMGGGERLLQEGVQHYRDLGFRVLVCTWHYDEKASFNGKYEAKDIVILKAENTPRQDILNRALSRLRTLGRLRAVLRQNQVSKVFVQGEYDVALVYLTTLFTSIRYRFLIFGQIFQYPHDSAKYSLTFRRHLREIVVSRPGYAETIPLTMPELSLPNRLANELICFIRLLAVRRAEKRFSFSRQIQWETELLFGSSTERAAGAFPRELLDRSEFSTAVLDRHGLNRGEYVLSLSRLDRKKRIDLIIAGFAASGSNKTLVIGGDGDDELFLRQCADRSGIVDRILFLGLVDESEMIPLKKHAALFVSMDIGDYDISPLEAMAVGTPVLCPTDFDADERLLAMDGFTRVEPLAEPVGAAMRELLAQRPVVDRAGLAAWSWSAYFDRLIAP